MTEEKIKKIIREYIELLNEIKDSDLDPHESVVKAIEKQLGPNRINLKSIEEDSENGLPSGFFEDFKKYLEEVSIKETGYKKSDGTIGHKNPVGGDSRIKGVFQIGARAIEDTQRLRKDGKGYSGQNISKQNWDKNTKKDGVIKSWHEQPIEDIFSNLNMQAAAAAFICLQDYYEAGKPSISSLEDRASFWKLKYNTPSDTSGSATVQSYIDKMKEFGISD